MSIAKYDSYKNSGVEWLGSVPSHWAIHRLKTDVKLVTEKATERKYSIALENIASWSGKIISTESEFEGEGTRFEVGDVLFGKLRPYLAKVHVAETGGEAVGDFHVLRPSSRVTGRYLGYFLLTREAISVIDGSTIGAKMPRASWEFMASLPVPLPSQAEQSQIVTFLDRETSKIDALVEEQKRLIELLKEKRQAVVSHAVTKGLDPSAPMKDSGLQWLGEIPAHWEVVRLKHVSPSITVGIVVNPSEYVSDDGLPFIYGGDIREGLIDTENCRRISLHLSQMQPKTMLAAGDLLTVRVGAPGVTAVVPKSCEGGNCASVMLIRKGDFVSEWLSYAMNSRLVRCQVERVQYGAAQEQFNIGDAVNFVIAVPPAEEQNSIMYFLGDQTGQIDRLVEASALAIALLQERRSALISAAVTGKIDVRALVSIEAEAA